MTSIDVAGTGVVASEISVNSTKAGIQASAERADRFFGRFGTFVVTLPESMANSEKSYASVFRLLTEAIRKDSHVTATSSPEFEIAFTRQWRGFPAHRRSTTSQILSGSDHFHGLRFNEPISFKVSIPAKNQPVIMGVDDVPSDEYWACWDGTTLVTLWRQAEDTKLPARSAGHVVESILRRAVTSVGLQLVVQACSPGCTNMYAHRTLRLDQFALDHGASHSLTFNGDHPRLIRGHLHSNENELEVVERVHRRLGYTAFHFARYKNIARRIINTELLARRLTDELLTLDLSNLYGEQEGFWASTRDRFRAAWLAATFRGRARRAKRIVDSLWIAMARIETLKREWMDDQRIFNEYATLRELHCFFDIDRKDDDAVVTAVTTDFVRAAVEHRSTRRDNRVIVWATIFGGISGALAAFAASVIVQPG